MYVKDSHINQAVKDIGVLFGPEGILCKALSEYEPRPGQITMARSISRTLKDKSKLVVEAGTGTGKTCAYLIPAILSGQKVVVSTGTKNLEEQIFYKDLPLLKRHLGTKFHAALMKGRRNYLCLRRWNRFIKEPMFDFAWEAKYFDRIAKWTEKTETGDRSEIRGLPEYYPPWREMSSSSENCSRSKCPEFSRCYVNRMRREAQEADLIVVNHALFFSDLGLKGLAEGVSLIPRYDAIIFDEAHIVPDAATSHFGVEVSIAILEDLLRDISRALARDKVRNAAVESSTLGIQSLTRGFFDSLGGNTQGERVRKANLAQGPGEYGAQLEYGLRSLGGVIHGLKGEEDWVRIAERANEIADEIRFLIEQPDEGYVYWRERRERFAALRASPIDLKRIFREKLYPSVGAIVFTSATLSVAGSVGHFQNTMGLNGDCDSEMVGTPFDLKNQAILYVPRDLPNPNSTQHIEAVTINMDRLVKLVGGRAFLLFSSYRSLEEAHRRLASNCAFKVLKQGDAPRSEILERFKAEPSVLFATHSFWQGVDVMGDALSLVVIDKLPFAVPTDPVVEARIEWINKNGGDGFAEYQLPHAVLMLKQGLGRLLRHRNDRGILAVLDPRIHRRNYGPLIRASLEDFSITDSWNKVEEFALREKIWDRCEKA